jgi:hypothetical protein
VDRRANPLELLASRFGYGCDPTVAGQAGLSRRLPSAFMLRDNGNAKKLGNPSPDIALDRTNRTLFKEGVLSVRFVRLSCAADMSWTLSVLSDLSA